MSTNSSRYGLEAGPIGVFDSGYGGLTILGAIRDALPEYDYVYLGDNARAPYGTRSFGLVYEFTLQAVNRLFALGCPLVILACNTASAKALRTIQQVDLPRLAPFRRVLGVIRPTAEAVGLMTAAGHVGLLATPGTVRSGSYDMEIGKLFPGVRLSSVACPMWVPLVENGEAGSEGADYFVKKHVNELLALDGQIDTIVLGCTHYPLLMESIRRHVPRHVGILSQGVHVARSLASYLRRHDEIERLCTKNSTCNFFTTESADSFSEHASLFLNERVAAQSIQL